MSGGHANTASHSSPERERETERSWPGLSLGDRGIGAFDTSYTGFGRLVERYLDQVVESLISDVLPADAWRGTIMAMTTDSLRNVKDRFSEFVDRVDREHDRVVITRNGRPTAVLISPDDLESLEETLELLSDQNAIRELVEAEVAVAAGDVVRGVDAVRALLPTSKV